MSSEQPSEKKPEAKTPKPTVDPQYEKLVASITKDVERKHREEQKDPLLRKWNTLGKRVMKIITKAKENPEKDLFKKSPNDLLPTTREAVKKEITSLINGKATKSAKEPRSSDAIAALANAFVAEELLVEKESKAKKVEASVNPPKTS